MAILQLYFYQCDGSATWCYGAVSVCLSPAGIVSKQSTELYFGMATSGWSHAASTFVYNMMGMTRCTAQVHLQHLTLVVNQEQSRNCTRTNTTAVYALRSSASDTSCPTDTFPRKWHRLLLAVFVKVLITF